MPALRNTRGGGGGGGSGLLLRGFQPSSRVGAWLHGQRPGLQGPGQHGEVQAGRRARRQAGRRARRQAGRRARRQAGAPPPRPAAHQWMRPTGSLRAGPYVVQTPGGM